MTPQQNPSLTRRIFRRISVRTAAIAGALLALALGWYGLYRLVEGEETQAIAAAAVANTNLARAFREHVLGMLQQVDLASITIAAEARRKGIENVDLDAYQQDMTAKLPYVIQVAAGDASGYTLPKKGITSRFYVGEREHFRVHVTADTGRLHVGRPVIGRMTKKWSLEMTRRLNTANGAFAGVLAISFNPEYFSRFYQTVAVGERGLVALIRDDGIVIARRASGSFTFGEDVSALPWLKKLKAQRSGWTLSERERDGTKRVMGFDSLAEYPLMVVVGTSLDEVLAPVKKRAVTYYFFGFGITALLLLVGFLTAWSFARQKRVNQALAKSEYKYRSLVEQASDGIFLCAANGRFTDVNEAGLSMLGYSREEVLQRNFDAFIDEDDLRCVPIRFERLRTGQPLIAERPLRHKDGRIIMAELNTRMLSGGEIVGIVRDITERKLAEAGLRLAASVFDNALDGIFITDENFRIVAVNRAFTDITGYSASDAIGNSPRLLRSYRHDEAFYEAMRRTISETGNWHGEVWDKRRNGEIYCELLSISAVRDASGEITNYCAIFADITERKIAETELSRLNAELEERVAIRTQELEHANRELDSFSYSVSHDLRAPLRAMTGFSAIVMDANRDKLDSESVGHLRRIQAGAQRMTELIEDLLDLARISRQEMHRENFSLSALAEQAAESLVQANPERTVRLTVQPDMHAHGDPRLIRIVLDNLLGNAWKFTAGTAEARIEVGQDKLDGESVFFVRDNGAGFDMQYADKLFGAFQRLHGQQEFEGTGIGLSIVQRIVIRHGGRAWADGKVGEGATFYFTLGVH
jgi:PAS domain S-box-containing protein